MREACHRLGCKMRGMAKNKRKRNPKSVLKLPDLEQSKSAVLNSLTSQSSQRSYDHAIREFIDWYCAENMHELASPRRGPGRWNNGIGKKSRPRRGGFLLQTKFLHLKLKS